MSVERHRLTVNTVVIDVVVAEAHAALPGECCGVLLGTERAVITAVPARNLSRDSTRFLIDPGDHFDARRRARERGLQVVGFYHSHPHSAPLPSPTDVAEASYAGLLYLILSLQHDTPEARLFRFWEGEFLEMPFAIVADEPRRGATMDEED